ncbi:ABC transporter related [Desulfofarcimen acetoxidans DSM 771]|uniref:ABC transporter related n=1 Tax=Desulfofarcimen acetoxidans (strain ATCC 49208 / DSM 771 / KCTC 5769 / VKM B-1644 / 5575) TaxID=485916 RepID=C8VXK4_DESAS|nr:ABC transporter ATP-binding protein [Desulfofarcimen acetoxidans]ACV62660.1 ABC transporter related [Desulfofarcimen acetoxidans DSM 771]
MIIKTDNLTKVYGNRIGCQNICLSINEGQIFGLLGPNGAGKSTLVKMLTGLLRPTSGAAQLLNRPLGDLQARKKIGFLPENFRYQEWLTGYELLSFHAALYKVEKTKRTSRIDEVLKTVGLAGREKQRIRTYSKGMQQRIGLACALLPDPDLLFLDEPTSALDPLGRREVREIVVSLRNRGKTVFLNSHLLSEVEMICDHVAIIKRGQIAASGTVNELLSKSVEVEMIITGMNEQIERELLLIGTGLRRDGERFCVSLDRESDIPRLAGAVVQNGGFLYRLAARRSSLEDLFVELISDKEDGH